jgi:hypothetical protein
MPERMRFDTKPNADERAIRILHAAWMEISGGESNPRIDAASLILHHAKHYLISQTAKRAARQDQL